MYVSLALPSDCESKYLFGIVVIRQTIIVHELRLKKSWHVFFYGLSCLWSVNNVLSDTLVECFQSLWS